MPQTSRLSWLGIGVIAFGVFVLTVAIPNWVTSPSNVRAIVLSPTFWPRIVAWLIILLGLVLVAMKAMAGETEEAEERAIRAPAAWFRLAAVAVIMVALVWATPLLGMVWTAMICFAALSFVANTTRPVASLVVAVALPLLLYAFFSHVAGVAVPQGEFITLP